MDGKRGAVLALLGAAVVALAGCIGGDFPMFGSSGNCAGGQGASGQQGVCNERDSFAYGLQGSKSGAETYRWENSGSRAQVAWGAQGSGSATVTITDDAGRRVFQDTFSGGQSGGSTRTEEGQPGTWTIRLVFSDFTGQGGLSVTRAS